MTLITTTTTTSESNDASTSTSTSSEPVSIRITNGGKMKGWVSYALDHFETNENQPIVLHTLPAPAKSQNSGPLAGTITTMTTDTSLPEGGAGPSNRAPSRTSTTSSRSLAPSTSTVPRLISVTEIVKREYLKSLDAKRSTRLVGLHQYNEFGILSEDEDGEEDAGGTGGLEKDKTSKRAENIIDALQGKRFPHRKQTPYMRITLSQHELPDSLQNGATYQPPLKRKLSKSAKARARKRARTEQEEGSRDEMIT
ncbi:hypothetical protein BDN72DRAFT_830624 [Pluteus cervinus]|uniref:Uncharacterized protein n=1 Tax=Pluteus cervinus TaxID=181527 RepID=A0ACD3BH68_9AGAR|nr:hypothetical protein BDN72DRAFT_830624 [Pluteus cervinus]